MKESKGYYLYKRGNVWWYRVQDPRGGKWSGGDSSGCRVNDPTGRAQAIKVAKRTRDKLVATAVIDGPIAVGPLTVERYALHTWIKERQTDDLDWKNDRGRLVHHVMPVIGPMAIADVRTKHLADLVRAIRSSGKLAQRSVYNVWSVVAAMFRDAAVAGLIDANPCHDIGKRQLGPLTDKDPEWRAAAVFTRAEAETLISHADIPLDRRLYYAFELLAGMRPGEIAARRWRDLEAAVEPLARLTIATAFSTRKNRLKSTKTNTTKIIPVHATLGAMLAEWRLSGWQAMCGRKPEPDDLILPLPPAAVEARRHRKGEPIRSGDYAGKKWREVDLPMLGWRHRRMYDGKATMITLAIDDGASRDIIKNRVTHARPVEDAFDHYYRGTQWLETCAELSKLKISRQPSRGKLVALASK